ncbi:ABC transporter ATP-binding protein [Ammoniphilus sp. YIM 78166]|uniref:ABC transporter ATP-binding protein n=1 Tax=Ammoniphilus sp. YIM 78166 TaxID=1644106 RepID=UPI001070564A|nr:dipeptide ABC transporter ATP-binding protein [Ammoniphilus sp. YIM 78166]
MSEQRKPILEVKGLKKFFPVKDSLGRTTGQVKAVNDVSFKLYEGETFGLVGESGCGKSTTGRTVLRLIDPTEGTAEFKGQNIFDLSNKDLRKVRKDLQMVFQDPYSSLNPRIRIGNALEETMLIHGLGNKQSRTKIAMEMLKKVGLLEDHYYRFPHEFSGGQRQRIGIARALVANPQVIVCDEPVSALDVSVQSQIINLLRQLQKEFKLSYLFIAHDLSVVRHISDRIGVMYLGNMVEDAPTESLFAAPLHPYTKALLSAVPLPNPNAKKERIVLKGDIPSPLNPPSGCIFHTRCPYVTEICRTAVPVRKEVAPEHFVACHLVG